MKKNRKIIMGAAFLTVLIVVLLISAGILISGKEDATYKEEPVLYGTLSKGITQTGSAEVGTTTQIFEPDISEYTEEISFSWQSSEAAMGFEMPGMTSQTATEVSATDSRQLTIEEIYIEAGQQIKKGDAILRITEESVSNIREELAQDASEANVVYEQMITSQKQSAQSAEATLSMNQLYGTATQSEYDTDVTELNNNLEEKQENQAQLQEELTEAQAQLEKKQILLTEGKQVLANAEYTAEGTDREESLYWWVVAAQTHTDAKEMVDTLEDEIESLQNQLEEYEKQLKEAQIQISLCEKSLQGGIIQAQTQMNLRNYNYGNAQEIYDIAVEQSLFDTTNAQKDYEEANTKLTDFDKTVIDQIIYAEFDGLITEVPLKKGDAITQNQDLFTLYDYNDVTITLSIEEQSIEQASLGSEVNVSFAAFADQVFKGKVTEIGDAEIDSNTNTTMYSVTVTIEEPLDLMYQDMTAEVTFVSEEKSVLQEDEERDT